MRYVILLLIGLTVETLRRPLPTTRMIGRFATLPKVTAPSRLARAILQRWEASGSDLSTAFEVGLLFRKVHDSVWNATHEQQEPLHLRRFAGRSVLLQNRRELAIASASREQGLAKALILLYSLCRERGGGMTAHNHE